jgi:hypothetical protein
MGTGLPSEMRPVTNLERATRKAEFHDAETTLQALSVT